MTERQEAPATASRHWDKHGDGVLDYIHGNNGFRQHFARY